MGKINLLVKYCLTNKEVEYNIKGILSDNKIKFLENDIKMILDIQKCLLKRITLTEEIIFDFLEKTCFIKDKNSNNFFKFNILVENLINNKNYFYVKYKNLENEYLEMIVKII